MDSFRNGRWIIPFKKFGRLQVKKLILGIDPFRQKKTHLDVFSNEK